MFRYVSDGPFGRLIIDRPRQRNAVPLEGWGELAAATVAAEMAAPCALIVQSAAEGAFCAGADLGHLATLGQDVGGRTAFRLAMRGAIDALAALPFPVIAAVDGGCFGAGVALMLACDVAVAGEGARFAVPPARLGIAYPQEDIDRLAARVGRGQAGLMLLGMETIDAAEAARIGLVERAVPVALAEAERLAAAMAEGAPSSFATLKRMIAGVGPGVDTDALFDASFGSADFPEGIAAYRERRKPEFRR
ncbi:MULTISPECIES: enoyl-CoA hydratase/isomerase family protein [Edaphosphingomonas]|uniref:Enoyl-CoA hydratase/isomerase family protein n=2 Tax=Edaphosphingomonas TaxID=3423724 RepID=A0A2T4HYH4_9SPHN|nr:MULTISPECIES: enoyl-CoA hydratase/isomerase family protein [Sphingomonas]OHT19542.1 putative enoyl-CoA hydratase echA8 [Sphingomonas haloaromaticamans]PTD21154.1 enoyl-CoA hydratase/isomerase family protein [Sphingomonas fennica]